MPLFLRRWLLPLSLSLNVFLAVLVLWHPRPPQGPPPPHMIVEHMVEGMSPADEAVVRAAFARNSWRWEGDRPMMEQLVPRMQAALSASQPDLDAIRAALGDAKRARNNFDDTLEAVILESAPLVSPEGRTKLFRQRHPPRPERH